MKTVAIIGVGLIGGSLGQALRKTKRYRVIGISRKAPSAREAKRLGAVDVASTNLADVKHADLVVISNPLDAIVPTLKRILPHLKSGAVVTDAGSTKGVIMAAASRLKFPRGIVFAGSHPLAGSHKTGVKASSFRLFERSTVVLVPGHRAALKALKSLWNAVGARVLVMSAEQHDRAVALTSHLPHAVAHALSHAFLRRGDRQKTVALLAGSFRDATRVASADAHQWAQILRANARALAPALKVFKQELTRIEQSLSRPALAAHLKKSQTFRRSLFHEK
jgi:prephenate dehydrogenase